MPIPLLPTDVYLDIRSASSAERVPLEPLSSFLVSPFAVAFGRVPFDRDVRYPPSTETLERSRRVWPTNRVSVEPVAEQEYVLMRIREDRTDDRIRVRLYPDERIAEFPSGRCRRVEELEPPQRFDAIAEQATDVDDESPVYDSSELLEDRRERVRRDRGIFRSSVQVRGTRDTRVDFVVLELV